MGELSPENFETAALLRTVNAIDELRGDLNDNDTLQHVVAGMMVVPAFAGMTVVFVILQPCFYSCGKNAMG